MTGPDGGPGSPPELDPDVLEELEFWGSDGDDPGDGDTDAGPHTGTDTDTGVPEAGAVADADTAHTDTGASHAGRLVLVGTPIGNLEDLSRRAVRTLQGADVIYCEDTRHSRKLLTHAGITGVPLRSLHEHNEHERVEEVVAAVGAGRTVVVVSDAGMPGVSDPGSRVVAAVADAGLAVTVVPGPSAVLAALVASGLPTDRFAFEGFLPRSGRERKERLAALGVEARTTVLFEAPGRVPGTLADLAEVCGESRPVAVARELTKLHEQVWRGSLAEAVEWASDPLRGEVVLVVGGAPDRTEAPVGDDVLIAAVSERLATGERTRGAVDDVASAFGVSRRRVYTLALAARATLVPPSD